MKTIKAFYLFCEFILSDKEESLDLITIKLEEESINKLAKDDESIINFAKMEAFAQAADIIENYRKLTITASTDILAGEFPSLLIDSIKFGVKVDFTHSEKNMEMVIQVDKEEKDGNGNTLRVMTPYEMIGLGMLNCFSMAVGAGEAVKELAVKNDLVNE